MNITKLFDSLGTFAIIYFIIIIFIFLLWLTSLIAIIQISSEAVKIRKIEEENRYIMYEIIRLLNR